MFCGLGEEERTKSRKKKEKKGINLIAAKSGLVGMKGYLEAYNHMKFYSQSNLETLNSLFHP